jgi:hypothetical protein
MPLRPENTQESEAMQRLVNLLKTISLQVEGRADSLGGQVTQKRHSRSLRSNFQAFAYLDLVSGQLDNRLTS